MCATGSDVMLAAFQTLLADPVLCTTMADRAAASKKAKAEAALSEVETELAKVEALIFAQRGHTGSSSALDSRRAYLLRLMQAHQSVLDG